MEQYILYRLEVYNPNQAQAFFAQQAASFNEGLQEKDEELKRMVEKSRASDLQKEIENHLLIQRDLEQQLNTLRTDAIEKNLFVKHLEKALNDTSKKIQLFSFIEKNETINNLNTKLSELQVERGRLLRIYQPSSDKLVEIDKQIRDAYSSLKSEVLAYKQNQVNQLRIINEKISSLKNRLGSINARTIELQKLFIDEEKIKRETNVLQTSYETFAKRREEAKIASTIDITNLSSYVSILSKAFPSAGPVFPKKEVVIPIGILAGFITGCSFGFLRQYFDHTFKKPSDVHNYAGLPLIFSLPDRRTTI